MKILLSNKQIKDIVHLYTSGEVSSTHKLAKIFKVGHKKISDILKKNNVLINKKGGQIKYQEKIVNQKRLDSVLIENNKKIIAICKLTGKVFNDYANKSGVLTTYIKDTFSDVIIPSQYKRNMAFKTTGNYWHELFFDLVEVDIKHKATRKCRYCDWETLDIKNKSGYYQNHLKKEHNKNLNDYLTEFPEDIIYHPTYSKYVKKLSHLTDEYNYVVCEICNEKFSVITNTHLKNKHNITMKKYNELYGNPKIVSKTVSNFLSESTKLFNQTKIFNNKSKEETEVVDFIKSLGVEVITNDRKLLKGMEIDILIPELKIGIEYNGILWHSEDFGSKDLNYHLNKTLLMNFAGYNLIHIFSDEWINNKNIVKEKIKHILKKSNTINIGARNCVIKKISFNEKCDFLNEFHIQSEDLSPINYGAFYDDILVGVMTFSNNRGMNNAKNDKNIFVLNRFATNNKYRINGLGSKILKTFIKEYLPKKIISFADRRWTLSADNNLYTKMGFTFVGNSKQSYFYFKRTNVNDRFHKFRLSKKNMIKKYGFDDKLTEWEMVKTLGYDRIWDCGLFKYEINF
jgi:hypothetical protein